MCDLGLRHWKASIDEGEPIAVAPPEIDIEDMDPDICAICLAKAYISRSGDALVVSLCMECGRPVCGSCADVDCDYGGDPGEYFVCSWQCPSGQGCRKAVA